MTYEEILQAVAGIAPSEDAGARTLRWLGRNAQIALARDNSGHLEVFLAGPRLECSSAIVRECLDHRSWYRSGDQAPLEANRILLSAAGYFDQIAAFLCTELLRNGADADLVTAFHATEPVIALTIERMRLGEGMLTGLAGELLLLDAMLRQAVGPGPTERLLSSWAGYAHSLRDFILGDLGVEVKTTTGLISSHLVEGVHQVEPDSRTESRTGPEQLYLCSIGIEWLPSEEGEGALSLEHLVQDIIVRLEAELGASAVHHAELFRSHVSEYGGGALLGTGHTSLLDSASLGRPFRVRFVRTYDMQDPHILVLRADDVRQRPFVELSSVRFRVNLPSQVSGDVNPILGLNEAGRLLALFA